MSAEGFRARARPEPPLAQILVVVANTLERSWRTDAEKGFLSTAVAQVLVDPKPRAKALQRGPHDERSSVERVPLGPLPRRGARAKRGGPSAVRNPFFQQRSSPRPFCAGRPGALPVTVLRQTRRRAFPSDRHPVRGGGPGADAQRNPSPGPLAQPGRCRAVGIRTALGAGQHGRARKRPTAVPQTAALTSPRAPRAACRRGFGRSERGPNTAPREPSHISRTVRHGEREPGQDSGTRRVGNVHLPGPYDSSERSDNQPGEAGGGPVESCLFC